MDRIEHNIHPNNVVRNGCWDKLNQGNAPRVSKHCVVVQLSPRSLLGAFERVAITVDDNDADEANKSATLPRGSQLLNSLLINKDSSITTATEAVSWEMGNLDANGEIIIHRKLLRRRHIAKLRKEREAALQQQRAQLLLSNFGLPAGIVFGREDPYAATATMTSCVASATTNSATMSVKHSLPCISPVHRTRKRAKVLVKAEPTCGNTRQCAQQQPEQQLLLQSYSSTAALFHHQPTVQPVTAAA